MMFFEIKMKKDRCRWCNTAKTTTTKKKTEEITYLEAINRKKNVPPIIFRGFGVRKKVGLMFWRSQDSMKSKCYRFSNYKERNKVCVVYLECKPQEDRYSLIPFQVKMPDHGTNNIFLDKQTTNKVEVMFLRS